jgi:hypothetical protein
MQAIVEEQGRQVSSEGWGTIANKHLFKRIIEQEKAWDDRESLIREMDPKMRNTKVEQNQLSKRMAEENDYYERILSIRTRLAETESTQWKEDHERDEGGKFTWINSQNM